MAEKITPRHEDFSKWYLDVVKQAELAENSEVRGCGIVKPYGYAIWEAIKQELDKRIKQTGVQNLYFPLFLPLSNLEKEKEHVEGFSPELAVVTHAGGEELQEPLVVRPTSEAAMYGTFAKWIKSHRDLPFRVNQWANVVRWEKRPRPFLRWSEFQWQEGHTVFASKQEAIEEMWQMLDVYESVYNWMGIPVLKGKKSEMEKFAGADITTTVEVMAQDGRAIQGGTSHHLGQNFAKVFEIKYLDENGKWQYAYQNSWGMSWRSIGALIMALGDDQGLRLSPNLAPIQVVIVPIYKEENKDQILQYANSIKNSLSKYKVELDDSDKTPGYKFNKWEAKGVPVRIEIGAKEQESQALTIVRRDTLEKQTIKASELADLLPKLFEQIHETLFAQAKEFQEKNIVFINSWDEIESYDGQRVFFKASWSESVESEKMLKDRFGITSRVLLVEDEQKSPTNQKCFITGEPAKHDWIFAKSY